jgi:hypothetical protein
VRWCGGAVPVVRCGAMFWGNAQVPHGSLKPP